MPDSKKKGRKNEKIPEIKFDEMPEIINDDIPIEWEDEASNKEKASNHSSEEEVATENKSSSDKTDSSEKSELELANIKADQLNERLLRTLAEYDNFRKRTQKEKDSIYPQAQADTVEKFLPIIDNFERAMQFECADAEFKKGVDMIFSTFMQTMKDLKVEEIGEEGETFNPDMHNAVMHVEDDAYGESIVAQVLQKGYKIGQRVVRYAMVKVAN